MPNTLTEAGWPINTDLSAMIVAAGLTAPASGRMDAMLGAAIDQWERETGYGPFLGTSQTRLYDPPGYHSGPYAGRRGGERILRLDDGLISVSALTIAGVTKTANTDFWLRPSNNPQIGRPYEWIEFIGPVFGQANDISVTGHFGFSDTVPTDAWWGVLYLAGCMALAEIKEGLLGNITEWTDTRTSERYGELTIQKLGSQWKAESDRRISLFKRPAAWL